MTQRDEILAWIDGLDGKKLTTANGAVLTVTRVVWTTTPPYWMAMDMEVLLDQDTGPNAAWLETDADVDWSGLLTQIGLPAGLTIQGHDRKIVDATKLRAILRLTV